MSHTRPLSRDAWANPSLPCWSSCTISATAKPTMPMNCTKLKSTDTHLGCVMTAGWFIAAVSRTRNGCPRELRLAEGFVPERDETRAQVVGHAHHGGVPVRAR